MKRRNRLLPFIILAIAFLIFIIRRWNEPVAKEAFDRKPKSLVYTKHALCRMDCQHISKEEIEDLVAHGSINFNKSKKRDTPCPTFALQGTTGKGESIRVIFGQCAGVTKVITCYNLKKDFECHCPGDGTERKNQSYESSY